MNTITRSRFESVAHLVVVAAMTISITSSLISFIGGVRFAFSDIASIFFLLSVVPWLFLVGMTVILNVAGSIHHRFSLWAMLLSLLAIIVSGCALPVVT